MQIKLASEEVSYLLRNRFLNPDLLSFVEKAERITPSTSVLNVTPCEADRFRDAFAEQMQKVGFDADYKPTVEGQILESLVDRFFVK